MPISRAAYERFRCDGATAIERTLADGSVERTRTTDNIPRRIRRAVLQRDEYTCRWPSCTNRGGVHIHHIVWRSRHGTHTVENFVVLCAYHHKAVHDRGWQVLGAADGQLEFVAPNGRVLTDRADPGEHRDVEWSLDEYVDHVDERTIATAWNEPVDIHWAVGVLRDNEAVHRHRN
jgi:hypothetical protein